MIQIGIISFGKMGQIRANSLESSGMCRINLFMNKIPCQKTFLKHQIVNSNEIINDSEIVAVFICTSNYLNKPLAIQALKAVKYVYAEKECFFVSLIELASWDWENTKVLVNHCDVYNNNNPKPQKGFLSLKEEIDAVSRIM